MPLRNLTLPLAQSHTQPSRPFAPHGRPTATAAIEHDIRLQPGVSTTGRLEARHRDDRSVAIESLPVARGMRCDAMLNGLEIGEVFHIVDAWFCVCEDAGLK